jgi:hypothetical protein
VHVFDPDLGPELGHNLNFNLAIVNEVERHGGVGCRVWGRLDLSAEARRCLPVHPFFVKGARWRWQARRWARRADPQAAGPLAVEREARKARKSRNWNEFHALRLRALAPGSIEPGDVVFFHSFQRWSAAGIATWLRDPTAADLTVVIFFMFTDYQDPSGRSRPEYEALLDTLASLPAERLFLVAETREFRDDLVRFSRGRLAIEIAPHIAAGSTLEMLRKSRPLLDRGLEPCVGYAGQNRPDRGSHLVHDVIEAVAERAPRRPRFRVHFQDRHFQPAELDRVAALGFVDVRAGNLPQNEFYRFLAGIDIVLLPYEPGVRTERQGSGIFWESLALGLVMVLPRDSHFEREARHWGGGLTTYEKWEASAIADATLAAIEGFRRLDPLARSAGARWNEARRLSTFIDRVLGERPGGVAPLGRRDGENA